MTSPDRRPEHSACRAHARVFDRAHRVELPADRTQPGVARRFVRHQLEDVHDVSVDDVVLAVSELVTNAVEYGSGEPITVELATRADAVLVRVVSPGPSPDLGRPSEWRPSDGRFVNGRGLAIVASVADGVHLEHDADCLAVIISFRR